MHEFNVVLKMWKLFACDEPDTPQRKRDRERNEKINFASKMLKENKITVENFLECVSNEEIVPNKGLSNLAFCNTTIFFNLFFFEIFQLKFNT